MAVPSPRGFKVGERRGLTFTGKIGNDILLLLYFTPIQAESSIVSYPASNVAPEVKTYNNKHEIHFLNGAISWSYKTKRGSLFVFSH